MLFFFTRNIKRRKIANSSLADFVDGVVGKIVNVKAEEAVLDERGRVDPARLRALTFDSFGSGYYVTGEQVGRAWNAGAALAKAK